MKKDNRKGHCNWMESLVVNLYEELFVRLGLTLVQGPK